LGCGIPTGLLLLASLITSSSSSSSSWYHNLSWKDQISHVLHIHVMLPYTLCMALPFYI
jgi:hypothetical protein